MRRRQHARGEIVHAGRGEIVHAGRERRRRRPRVGIDVRVVVGGWSVTVSANRRAGAAVDVCPVGWLPEDDDVVGVDPSAVVEFAGLAFPHHQQVTEV